MDVENKSDYCIKAQTIKPIKSDTVHKICSGQVVLSLAVAVKELLENALDAGATSIDIRLKNYGVDLIEVSDNGSGVTEDNFAALTLKYHTSKLNEYSDLLGVSSFGFRGEALSSLCALSNLTITTRHQSSEYATKLEFDHHGNITKKTPCSRQVGTTVSLSNLFASLPVRQKELHKNVKREFNKMTNLLYAYCLISVGVKITCSNQTNSKSLVVATQGSKDYKDNIACVFGIKQVQSILEIRPEYVPNIKENIFKGLSGELDVTENTINIEDVEIDLSEDSNDAENNDSLPNSLKSQGHKNDKCPIEFTGFVSSCAHGSGRSTTDRQFYFVNSRPCEPTKVMKLVNEVYKQYNQNQYPFVFLNISLDTNFVDVNVTPDKRKVFLTKEKLVLDVLKSSLLKLFENIPRTIKLESTLSMCAMESHDVIPDVDQPRVYNSFLQRFASKSNSAGNSNKVSSPKSSNENVLKRKSTTMLDFISSKTTKFKNGYHTENNDDTLIQDNDSPIKNNITHMENIRSPNNIEIVNVTSINKDDWENRDATCYGDTYQMIKLKKESDESYQENKEIMYLEYTDKLPNTQIRNLEDVLDEKSHSIEISERKTSKIVTDKEDLGRLNRKFVKLKTSLDHVKALSDIYNKQNVKSLPERVKFKSEINPVFNKKCEEELSKEIAKEDFKRMIVLGQFNLGFIITSLDDDLFIIDQHATDEIYNFETLQKTTELTSQKLVIPQQLELTGMNEQILMENLQVFNKNGFTFIIDKEALPTKRVQLLTIPMSKNWMFGKDDIEELLFMLRESPSEHCRPSRVRAMFASRACRKSVMIGTALSKADMKKLVDHMAEIDHPWNCPHGRPTIRHLVNLAMVHTRET